MNHLLVGSTETILSRKISVPCAIQNINKIPNISKGSEKSTDEALLLHPQKVCHLMCLTEKKIICFDQ